jgi:uncharacterized protein YbbC (DUF1343 family)
MPARGACQAHGPNRTGFPWGLGSDTSSHEMLCGVDLLSTGQAAALRRRLRNKRVGCLTHASAVDRRGRRSLDVLEELGASCTVVFSPEHGLDGVDQAEVAIADDSSGYTSRPRCKVVSLYGGTRESLIPPDDVLAETDILVIDLVDIGSRYYTYVWTAWLALKAASQRGVHTVVLDRPNPISGDPCTIEGAPQEPEFLSFVGLEPIPIRHALSLGEILCYLGEAAGLGLGAQGALSVVRATGWERHRTAEAWGRPFVPPSPNIPTLETALVYPGACLLEGTNLSEGRGTTSPFQTVGAPFVDSERLAADLLAFGVSGALVRPVSFRPMFGKHANQVCHGVMVHVTDTTLFRPVATYVALIALARAQAGDQFEFLPRAYEYESSRIAFDLLAGTSRLRVAMQQGATAQEAVQLIVPVDPIWREIVATAEQRANSANP